MFRYKYLVLLAGAILIHVLTIAQTTPSSPSLKNEGLMRSEGKIYVVMVVSLIVLTGLILYLLRLERKISKLEKTESF